MDKGMTMVVMDKKDYTEKALSLLTDTSTYRIINKDPTNKLKNKLTQTLRDTKQKGGLSDCCYRKVYPISAIPQSFIASQKYIKLASPSDSSFPVGVP